MYKPPQHGMVSVAGLGRPGSWSSQADRMDAVMAGWSEGREGSCDYLSLRKFGAKLGV